MATPISAPRTMLDPVEVEPRAPVSAAYVTACAASTALAPPMAREGISGGCSASRHAVVPLEPLEVEPIAPPSLLVGSALVPAAPPSGRDSANTSAVPCVARHEVKSASWHCDLANGVERPGDGS